MTNIIISDPKLMNYRKYNRLNHGVLKKLNHSFDRFTQRSPILFNHFLSLMAKRLMLLLRAIHCLIYQFMNTLYLLYIANDAASYFLENEIQ